LHGPVLAKNPEFADSYLLEIAAARGVMNNKAVNNEVSRSNDLKNNADLVAGIVKQVWELERDLASE
jgi:CobQ-like glutamine amidotransferase family enzyme